MFLIREWTVFGIWYINANAAASTKSKFVNLMVDILEVIEYLLIRRIVSYIILSQQ